MSILKSGNIYFYICIYFYLYICIDKILFSARLISIKFQRCFIFRTERMKTANKSRLTNNNSDRAVSFFVFAKNCLCN